MHTNTQKILRRDIVICLFLTFCCFSAAFGQFANDPPTMDQPDPIFLNRNAEKQPINLTGITDNEFFFTQNITISATADNSALIKKLKVEYDGTGRTGTVTFDIGKNESGRATITITLEDQDGPTSYNVLVVVNDPPVVDIPDQEVQEGNSFRLTLDNFVSDPDTGDEFITWTASGNSQLTVEIDNSTRTATITPPNAEWNGSETITFTANDNVESFPLEGSDAALFTVTAVNDAPVLSNIEGTAITYTEGDAPAIITSKIKVADIDNSNLSSAKVYISSNFKNGEDVLAFTDANNISGSYDSKKGILTLSGSSSVANYQAALRSVTYQNTNTTSPNSATRTVTFTVSDGTDESNQQSRNINVINLNNAPVLSDIEGSALDFTEGDAAKTITSTLKITDDDNPNVESAVVSISHFVSSEDVLSFSGIHGISGSFDSSKGELRLSGTASLADYQDALRSVKYQNTNDVNPNTTTRTISFTVSDGTETSDAATRDINIIVVNSAPRLAGIETDPINFAEGDPPVTITSNITISDVDNTTLQSALVLITSNYVSSEDVLAFTNANGITGSFDSANGTLKLEGSSSLSNYQAALRSVTYQNKNDLDPQTATRSISFVVNDGTENSNLLSREIEILTINNAPYFDAISSPISIDEDAGQQTLKITGINAGPGESQDLSFSISYDNEELIADASINYTSPDAEASLAFTTLENATGTANLEITLTDNGPSDGKNQNSFSRNVQVNVNPVNDVPKFTSTPIKFATAASEYNYAIVVTDPDAGDKITIEATAVPDWLTFTDNGDGTATLTGIPSLEMLGVYSVSLETSDKSGASDTQSFTIQVVKDNKKPEFLSEPITMAAETYPYSYTIKVDDDDVEDVLTVTATKKPEWLKITNNTNRTAILTGRPLQGDAGDYDITLQVSDSRGGVDEQTFVLSVLPFSQSLQLTIDDGDLLYEYRQDSILLTSTADIFSYDGGTLTSAKIVFEDNYVAGVDSLSATVPPSIYAFFRNGQLILEGEDSLATYEEVLSSVYYHHKGNSASGQPKRISFQVNNISLKSNKPAKTIRFEEALSLNIPNGFTPNDDGSNDQWIIGNIDAETLVRVFTRSGNKIFESEDYSQQQENGEAWNGKDVNGNVLPAGVYFYVINNEKYGTSYKGTVTILK